MTIKDYQELVNRTVNFICEHQLPSGAIPEYEDGTIEPWCHVECAIALDLCGRIEQSDRAYRWLRETQNPDGSWWYTYRDEKPREMAKDSNHSSYIATGAWYHYMATRDISRLQRMWPVVERGIDFAIGLQQPGGEIFWARDDKNEVWPSALLTASSCIYQSILDGVKLARVLKFEKPDWEKAAFKLARVIRGKPHIFDTAGDNHRGYAMNWYYPILTGVVSGREAQEHIVKGWTEFIIDGSGCRCSLDQPWVTVAETCELVVALTRIGEVEKARKLLDWVLPLQDDDGGFWTGIRIPEEIIYPPDEKTTWTSAAMIIAMLASIEGKDPGNSSV